MIYDIISFIIVSISAYLDYKYGAIPIANVYLLLIPIFLYLDFSWIKLLLIILFFILWYFSILGGGDSKTLMLVSSIIGLKALLIFFIGYLHAYVFSYFDRETRIKYSIAILILAFFFGYFSLIFLILVFLAMPRENIYKIRFMISYFYAFILYHLCNSFNLLKLLIW